MGGAPGCWNTAFCTPGIGGFGGGVNGLPPPSALASILGFGSGRGTWIMCRTPWTAK